MGARAGPAPRARVRDCTGAGAATRVNREVGREVSTRPAGLDRPAGHGSGPAEAPGRQPDPGNRIGLDDVGRGAPGMPWARHALHRGERGDPHLHGLAGNGRRQQAEQVPDRDAERVRGRRLTGVERTGHRGHARRVTRIRAPGPPGRGGTPCWLSGHACRQPKMAGKAPRCTSASSASEITNRSATSRLPPPTAPMSVAGTP